ncbi:ethanolamine ammonia-lyase reactivating factor EutA [Hyphococcus luteus]|uniref:Ethanolamine utilization protein EutA n=1 Tax=Hyphococcus luteus TaxID=2058213 RepID=A0A2S7K539_9PROT|nr:ethanolamine ammonia-lyase reactivating factor EutA [Marinicaulis flavus]PQA87609.1 ethanolamine utilization protein EutA [Marinicaulis flavus]
MPHDAPWEHYHDLGDPLASPGDTISLTTVGFDIGSSTSQLAFSGITLVREDAHYVVAERKLLHESKVILTPYSAPGVIDSKALGAFIDEEYANAEIEPGDVDSGAVILTGLALASQNARPIADAVADDSGKFVAVSAGDLLETRLSAAGVGAAAVSAGMEGVLAHIDVGGGTTKISVWRNGELIGLCALDVGARVVKTDEKGVIVQIEEPARKVREDLDLDLWEGEPLKPEIAERIAGALARNVLRYVNILEEPPRGQSLLRTDPLYEEGAAPHIDAVLFAGGVSEYIYGRETRTFGDLGLLLGQALRREVDKTDVELVPFDRGIRATVLGVAQHSVQLTGNTIFVSDPSLLPIRNAPILRPKFDLGDDAIDGEGFKKSIADALPLLEGGAATTCPGVAFAWRGPATYSRLGDAALAVHDALSPRLREGSPFLVVIDGDVAGVFGARLSEIAGNARGVVCLDGVHVHEFDHIDAGELLPASGALPVVIKSLLFASSVKQQAHSHD